MNDNLNDNLEETQENEVSAESQEKETGTVKWFSSEKGYGFIQPDEEGKEDVFVHRSQAPFSGLMEGQKVEYVLSQTDKGLAANSVKVLA